MLSRQTYRDVITLIITLLYFLQLLSSLILVSVMAFSAINIHINVSIILDPVFDDVSPVFMEGYSDSLVH